MCKLTPVRPTTHEIIKKSLQIVRKFSLMEEDARFCAVQPNLMISAIIIAQLAALKFISMKLTFFVNSPEFWTVVS